METLDFASVRRQLEEHRNTLESRIAEEQDATAPGKVFNPDQDFLAWSYDQQQRRSALVDSLERELEQVQAALQRLEQGDYGVCQQCGEPINADRLAALPFAALCIRCQQQKER